jgi:hypothetical protein
MPSADREGKQLQHMQSSALYAMRMPNKFYRVVSADVCHLRQCHVPCDDYPSLLLMLRHWACAYMTSVTFAAMIPATQLLFTPH